MDLASSKYIQASSLCPSNGVMKEPVLQTSTSIYENSQGNPFGEAFPDPLCKLNLKETSEFVKSLPMAPTESRGFLSAQRRREGTNSVTITQRRVAEAPSTPGRPVFSFSGGSLARKSIPSKWDDAEKWLMNSSGHDCPAHPIKRPESSKMTKQMMVFAEKSRVIEQEVPKLVSSIQGCVSLNHHNSARGNFDAVSAPTDVLLKDKFTDGVEPVFPNLRYLEPSKEGFLFENSACETMKDAGTEVVHEVKHRDFGTEMTPLGSSTTSRCHTPLKSSSPARHNTPANRSGPLVSGNSSSSNTTIDVAQLQEFHLAKLQLGTQYDPIASNWSSREEEEEEISKSLRHFETGIAFRKSISDSRAAAWEEEEKTKCCLRYQREEAKIQAWVNLQNAKAEAQSRKLEVKIQKMRSNLEEKLMKRMTIVHRKAEEWRSAALQQHADQIQRAADQGPKMNRPNSQISGHVLCGCFPCNNSC